MKNSRLVMASLSLLLGVASSECGGGDSSREAGNAGDIAGITASCAAYIAEGAIVLALVGWWLTARGLPSYVLPGPPERG